jgi:hypothetical protein
MSTHDERRRLPRRRTRVSAAAVDGEAVVACTIRDKSDSGARLLIQAGASVPDAFTLIELTSGDAHDARVVWRDDAFVGVTFQGTRSLESARTPTDLKLAEIRRRLTSKTGR